MDLKPLSATEYKSRAPTAVIPHEREPFRIVRQKDAYKHQFAHIYFTRLQLLRPSVLAASREKWENLESKPGHVSRVLEVKKSKVCYVVGTVYMDMPLKPNVIDELSHDNSLGPPQMKETIYSPDDKLALEDESGRVRLVGKRLENAMLVTGVIIGVLGMETEKGEFEVFDLCYAGMVPQRPDDTGAAIDSKMDVDGADSSADDDEWIAAVSGLEVGARSPADGPIQLLVDYLVGEGGAAEEQFSSSRISRLFIIGDSMATILEAINAEGFANGTNGTEKKLKWGQETMTYSQVPLQNFTSYLLDIARTLPVHILPGATDPAGGSMPQQAFPRGMFGPVSKIPAFSSETNPAYINFETAREDRPLLVRHVLANSGQPLNDMVKYMPTPPMTRLSLLERTLKWRHIAPTAPDTLWCFPYVTEDPFIMEGTPDIYLVGGQPEFGTKLASEKQSRSQDSLIQARCRIVLVPLFSKTGTLVLVNVRTLEVRTVEFAIDEGLHGGVQDDTFENISRLPTPEPPEDEDDEEEGEESKERSAGSVPPDTE